MFDFKDGFIISLSYDRVIILPRSISSTSRDAVFAVYMADYHVVHKGLLTHRINKMDCFRRHHYRLPLQQGLG